MTATISRILDGIIGLEGGYVHHVADLGGPTIWGITERTAKAYGYEGNMRDLTREKAEEIYYHLYVLRPGYDKLEPISSSVMAVLIDIDINMGPIWGVKWLQRTINYTRSLDQQLTVDGKLGDKTLEALKTLILHRGIQGIDFVLKGVNILRGQRYFEITDIRQENRAFIVGWVTHRIHL